jgi:hypothetical protein
MRQQGYLDRPRWGNECRWSQSAPAETLADLVESPLGVALRPVILENGLLECQLAW